MATPQRGVRFDHAVILVDDLVEAVRDFSDLGFTVVPGGEHVGGLTHNALIVFDDGTYLELLAFKRRWIPRVAGMAGRLGVGAVIGLRRTTLERRMLQRAAAGEGFVDFALQTRDLQDTLRTARELGAKVDGPVPGGRLRPDGHQVAWALGVPQDRAVPFLISDVTPRPLRVPEGTVRRHRNGALGISGVVVAVGRLEEKTRRYTALLGLDAQTTPSGVRQSVSAAGFLVGGVIITLVKTGAGDTEISRYVQRRGEGPYAISLQKEGAGGVHTLNPAKTHGAHISFLREPGPTDERVPMPASH